MRPASLCGAHSLSLLEEGRDSLLNEREAAEREVVKEEAKAEGRGDRRHAHERVQVDRKRTELEKRGERHVENDSVLREGAVEEVEALAE